MSKEQHIVALCDWCQVAESYAIIKLSRLMALQETVGCHVVSPVKEYFRFVDTAVC